MPSLCRARSANPAGVDAHDTRRVRVRTDLERHSWLGMSEQLTITLDRNRRACRQDLDAEALGFGQNHGSVEQSMRRVGHHDHSLRPRRDERPAGREGVGGRALRRRRYHAVTRVPHKQFAIDAQGERRLTTAGNAGEDDIVVGDLPGHILERGERKPGARLHRVVARCERRQGALEVRGVDLGQVPEPPEVDAQNWDAVGAPRVAWRRASCRPRRGPGLHRSPRRATPPDGAPLHLRQPGISERADELDIAGRRPRPDPVERVAEVALGPEHESNLSHSLT